jgi:tetratricopeptide (TPR) repeat protein
MMFRLELGTKVNIGYLSRPETYPERCSLINLSMKEELGNFSGALSYYKPALSEDPEHVGALIGVALSLEHLGNHTEAMRYYKQALAQPPNQQPHNNVNLIQRADAFVHLGNYSQANTIIN